MPETDRPTRRNPRRPRAPLIGLAGLTAWMVWRSLRRSSRAELAVAAAARRRVEERPMTAYEPTDWNLGPVALVYAGTLALLVISCIVLIAAYPRSLPDVDRTLRIAPPGPRLQTDPAADLRKLQIEEGKRLNTYYWIDKRNGVVHIPIEAAMKKLADSGIPGFPKDTK
jgi:hypothetical protein